MPAFHEMPNMPNINDETRGTCDACHYPDTPVREYGSKYGDFAQKHGRQPRFCRVCEETFISFVETEPERLMNPIYFYRSMGRIANLILDAIQEIKTGRRR